MESLFKLHRSCHLLDVKTICANWVDAGLWLIYLAVRGKLEASCQLLFAQAARIPSACQHSDPMKGQHAQQLLCFQREHQRSWEIASPCNLPSLISLPSPLQQHQRWKGSFRQQRAAAQWREHDRSCDSSRSWKKASERRYPYLHRAPLKRYLFHFISLGKPSHTLPAASVR